MNGIKSQTTKTNFGVQQGSILGIFLFLIYINDKTPSGKEYADDTVVPVEGQWQML